MYLVDPRDCWLAKLGQAFPALNIVPLSNCLCVAHDVRIYSLEPFGHFLARKAYQERLVLGIAHVTVESASMDGSSSWVDYPSLTVANNWRIGDDKYLVTNWRIVSIKGVSVY